MGTGLWTGLFSNTEVTWILQCIKFGSVVFVTPGQLHFKLLFLSRVCLCLSTSPQSRLKVSAFLKVSANSENQRYACSPAVLGSWPEQSVASCLMALFPALFGRACYLFLIGLLWGCSWIRSQQSIVRIISCVLFMENAMRNGMNFGGWLLPKQRPFVWIFK